jgi:hypothetical protein
MVSIEQILIWKAKADEWDKLQDSLNQREVPSPVKQSNTLYDKNIKSSDVQAWATKELKGGHKLCIRDFLIKFPELTKANSYYIFNKIAKTRGIKKIWENGYINLTNTKNK